MNNRYTTTRPRSAYYDQDDFFASMPSSITVVEEEDHPAETGLLDQHGNPLYRVRNRVPMGFRK